MKSTADILREAKEAEHGKILEALLPAAEKLKNNKALAAAKTFNSLPFFLNLVIISPFLLGVAIPKYTYKLTQKANGNNVGMPEMKTNMQLAKKEDTKTEKA